MATRRLPVDGVQLDVCDWGSGEPIVFVQTALTADELLPLAQTAAFGRGYRKIVYHRRGYANSSAVHGPGSIARDAADCRALLHALGIDRAHIIGVSYSAAVALQLAAHAPQSVHTLVLVEPPPVHTPTAAEFRAANDHLVETRRRHGPVIALDEFLSVVIGPDWRDVTERYLPGSAAQMAQDAATFFDTDLPALLGWRFGPADAGRITCPVLHVGGTDSGPWFAEVRDLMLEWLPSADDVVIEDADHSLALTHCREIADAVAAFLHSHPVDRDVT
jgi:pimeloyl-ACP methyl ester carboxylesterase